MGALSLYSCAPAPKSSAPTQGSVLVTVPALSEVQEMKNVIQMNEQDTTVLGLVTCLENMPIREGIGVLFIRSPRIF
jgi:hypothetical protein